MAREMTEDLTERTVTGEGPQPMTHIMMTEVLAVVMKTEVQEALRIGLVEATMTDQGEVMTTGLVEEVMMIGTEDMMIDKEAATMMTGEGGMVGTERMDTVMTGEGVTGVTEVMVTEKVMVEEGMGQVSVEMKEAGTGVVLTDEIIMTSGMADTIDEMATIGEMVTIEEMVTTDEMVMIAGMAMIEGTAMIAGMDRETIGLIITEAREILVMKLLRRGLDYNYNQEVNQ